MKRTRTKGINLLTKARGGFAALLVLALLLGSALPSLAAGSVDTEEAGSIAVHHKAGAVDFSLYKVADVVEGDYMPTYALTGSFTAYQVAVNGLDSSGWSELAGTLSAYIKRDGIAATMKGTTDSDGNYTWNDLPVGLYLLVSDSVTSGGYSYEEAAQMVAVPGLDADEEWDYSVSVEMKVDGTVETPDDEEYMGTVSRTVNKVWSDDDDEEGKRPSSVNIQLLQDTEVYETVTLNSANSWTYTWTGLSPSYTWSVVEEEVPDSYTVSVASTEVSDTETTFTVTNTYLPDENMISSASDSTSSNNESESVDSNVSSTSSTSSSESSESLPQTGQLWWPVSVLALAGILSLGAGLIQGRKKD